MARPEVIRAIARHAAELDPEVAAKYRNPVTGKPISRRALLAKLVKGESGGRHEAVSSAGARGEAQFIRPTRDAVVRRTGGKVDPWRNADDAVEAAVMHLNGELGNAKGLEGYNPGGGQSYVSYILGQRVGDVGGGKDGGARGGASAKASSRTVTETTPGIDRSEQRKAVKLAYLAQRGKPGSLLALKAGLDENADTPSETTRHTERGLGKKSAGGSGGDARGAAGEIKEMFYNGPGGVNADEGKRVGKGFVSGHTDHVHIAAGPKRIQQIARLAQGMGLTVRELEGFDKVDPVHTQGSFHYRKQAADISGDAKKMAEFTRRIARRFNL